MKTRKASGFSLLEVMFSIAILAVIGTGLILVTSGGKARASSQSVAARMAEVFKQAREQAVAQQRPVAVVVPVTASNPLADSCYLISGAEQATVSRTINFQKEFPGTYLFSGHWSLASGSWNPPSLLSGSHNGDFDLTAWTVPEPSHAIFCYTPSGTLQSNRAEFGQSYHLVICSNAQSSASSVAGIPSAALSAADSPVTLRLSKTGQVSILGQVAQQSGVQVVDLPAYSGTVLPSLTPSTAGNTEPTIVDIQVAPKPEPGTVPSDVDATVAVDGYLTLTAQVSDPEGDAIEVQWSSVDSNNPAALPGAFSSPIKTETDPESGVWESTWEWRPPPTTVPGDRYTLTMVASDDKGAVTTGSLGTSWDVETLDPGTILFVDDRNGNREVYTMNSDGTNEVRLTRSGGDKAWPQLSPDGSRIMYVHNQGGNQVLMTMGVNGENPTQVLTPAGLPPRPIVGTPHDAIVSCCWSPDGSRIAVIGRYGGPTGGHTVFVSNADGSGIFRPHSPSPVGGLSVTGAAKITWNFDPPYDRNDLSRQRLLYTSPFDNRYFAFFLDPPRRNSEQNYDGRTVEDFNSGPDGRVTWIEGGQLRVGDFTEAGGLAATGTLATSVSNPAGPVWSPTASSLVFSGGGAANPRLYRVEATGANLVTLTAGSSALEASWGP